MLREEGFKVETASSGEACLSLLESQSYELILLDVWLPGIDGLETLEELKRKGVSSEVVMISGHGTIETAVKATRLGAFDFVEKPLSIEKTLLVVKNALDHKHLQDENRTLRSELGARYRIVGSSVPMKALRQQLAIAAPTNGRVLIFGESGSGKELVAHALHHQSLRNSAPLVEVNCAAIPDELIESELFGHVKGAFTGATQSKIGKLEKADGGTLFLDEVGDMSLKTQAKVLRALEEQRFEPVGSSAPISVDVRVIAATNKNLNKEMERGNFRQDLFYRLNVIPFYVPPLRERVEDVPVLTEHFIQEFSQLYGRKAKEVSPEALDILKHYRWPGNVRELKNLVERMVIMTPGSRLEVRFALCCAQGEWVAGGSRRGAKFVGGAPGFRSGLHSQETRGERRKYFPYRRCARHRTKPPLPKVEEFENQPGEELNGPDTVLSSNCSVSRCGSC